MNLQMNNRVIEEVWEHPDIVIAREAGDIDRVLDIQKRLRMPDGRLDMRDFTLVDRSVADNINVLEGKELALELITAVTANASLGWYIVPSNVDDTPQVSWTAGDIPSREFTAYTGNDPAGQRQKLNFTAATGSGSRADITNTSRAELDITGADTIHGVFVVSEPAKSSAAGTLLAAVHYTTPKAYEIGQKRYLGYQMYIP